MSKKEEVKEIKSLTKEQEALIPVYLEKYKAIGLSTGPCNREEAEKAITDSYVYLKHAEPKFVWVNDPFEGALLAAQHAKGSKDITEEDIKKQASEASYGSFEAQWVSFYAYIAEVLPVQKDNLHEIVSRIVTHCGVYWTFDGLVIISEKPIEIHMEDSKLHNPDGLALKYPSGRGIYALNGERFSSLLEMKMKHKYKEESGSNEEVPF